jgi:hypothetical protein
MSDGLYRPIDVQTALNAKQDSLNYTAEDTANKELVALDTSLVKYPCNNVVKVAVDGKLNLPTGTPDGTKFLRDDNSWQPVPSAGAAAWGSITGTLSSQTDLQTALNGKLNLPTGTPDGTKFLRDDNSWQPIPAASVAWGAITGTLSSQTDLQTALNGKVDSVSASTPLASTGGTTPTISITQASGSSDGYLSSTDWNTFNSKEPALTKGNLTEATSSILTITGGTNAVIGSGVSIQVAQASGSISGYLSFTDWTTFNNKGNGTVTSITASSPLTGGTITSSGSIGIGDAKADSLTKGASTFKDSDFNDDGAGLISIDYTNGQSATSSTKGFLTSTDWSTFNGKQDALVSGTNIKTVNAISLLGSGDIDIHGLTINVQALTSSPADGATIYFGMLPKAPVTTGAISKIFIRKAGTIKHAEIYCYSGTAGSAESWSLYIRKNNTTDTLIATVAAATNERVFSNSSLSISMAVGDYFEIKAINPTWGTNPLTTIFGGYIYIE